MKTFPLLFAFLLAACASRSFTASQDPAEPLRSYDYVDVQQFEIGDLGHLPVSDQMTARALTSLLARQLRLKLYERGMFTASSGDKLIITGKLVGYDPGDFSFGQGLVFLTWLGPYPPPAMVLPLPWPIWPVYPPLLPSKVWESYAGTGSLFVETRFTAEDGTVVAMGTTELDVSISTAGGNVMFAARDLVTAISDYVEANY